MHAFQDSNEQPATIRIPDSEITFSCSNSGGPGGQNVNKRQTKVRLSFDVMQSPSLTLEQKTMILQHPKVSHLVHSDGIISIATQIHKTQGQNKATSVEQLHTLLEEILKPAKERIPGGRPPGANFPPSDHRKRQERRAKAALQRRVKKSE